MAFPSFKVIQETLKVRSWAFLNVPLIFYCSPTIEELNDDRCVVRIPLGWRTKNHLGSMYFGTLAVGADVAGGLLAMKCIEASNQKVSLVFKDFKANFLKRPEGDVDFICEDGPKIRAIVEKAIASGERVNELIRIVAKVPSADPTALYAEFDLTLSLKRK